MLLPLKNTARLSDTVSNRNERDVSLNNTAFASSCRYKMISEFTWPNHDLGSDQEAVRRLLQGCGFDHDVAYGKTKVFVRTPRTLFSLEEQRAEMVQRIVLFLQKVRIRPLSFDITVKTSDSFTSWISGPA